MFARKIKDTKVYQNDNNELGFHFQFQVFGENSKLFCKHEKKRPIVSTGLLRDIKLGFQWTFFPLMLLFTSKYSCKSKKKEVQGNKSFY